ncbi:MAG: multidrug effflux MFS transporter, partial [Actinomycetes bacterium]
MTALIDSQVSAATSASPYVGRRYLKLVVVLGALSAIGPLTIDAYLPALPELRTQLGASETSAQATITALLVGLGLGQLIIGPLSDAVGRRRPLLLGLVAHAAMSVLCALAPSIPVLIATRARQGMAGAAVAVVAMAMVRDLFSGVQAARLLSRILLVIGVAPILAPSLGSALLALTSWRGIFVALAAAAAALLVLAVVALPETLPPSRRQPATVRASLRSYGRLFADRTFVVLAVVAGLLFGTLFAYIAGSAFVLQGGFGLSPQQFGVAFAVNAFGLILMTQLNPLLLRRYTPMAILTTAVTVTFAASLALLTVAVTGFGGLLGFSVPLWVVVAAIGLSFPNAPAIALNRHGDSAGAASALLGGTQAVAGGAVAPLVGVLGSGAAAMAVV